MFQNTDRVLFGNPQNVATIEQRMIPGDRRRFNALLRDTKCNDEHGNFIGLSGQDPKVREVSILNEKGEQDSLWYLVSPELPHSESMCVLLQRSGISWSYLVYKMKDGVSGKFNPIMNYSPEDSSGGGYNPMIEGI